MTGDLIAVAGYARKIPAVNGRLFAAGYCWGGAHRSALPPTGRVFGIRAPVYGFYGGNDARATATIPKTQERVRDAAQTYEPVTYEGAGHGFMRAGDEPDASPANRKARQDAWAFWLALLKKR